VSHQSQHDVMSFGKEVLIEFHSLMNTKLSRKRYIMCTAMQNYDFPQEIRGCDIHDMGSSSMLDDTRDCIRLVFLFAIGNF